MKNKLFKENLIEFKELKWIQKDENSFLAEPEGLHYNYYITGREDGKFELFFINKSDHYKEGESKLCSSLAEAQEIATKHYTSTLSNLIHFKS